MKTRTNLRKNEAAATTEPATPETQAASENAPSMDELAARVAEAEKTLATATSKSFTASEFAAYVSEQIEKAKGEDAEKGAARLKALQDAIALAKTAFEQGTTASIPVYHDPWQQDSTTKAISSPTGVSSGTSNVGYPTTVDTAKRCLVIAKALREDATLVTAFETQVPVAKSAGAAVPVTKAGEAAAMLDRIAAMFGVELEDEADRRYCELRWNVGDIISTLVEVDRAEKALSKMQALMAGTAPTTPTVEPAAMAEGAAKAAVAKADDDDYSISVGNIQNADGWPVDMNASSRVTKSAPKAKGTDEELRF